MELMVVEEEEKLVGRLVLGLRGVVLTFWLDSIWFFRMLGRSWFGFWVVNCEVLNVSDTFVDG